MRKIILDGSFMRTREMSHLYLKKKLRICGYYGNNLDALWDVISTYSQPLEIDLVNEERIIMYLDAYGKSIIELFKEATYENPNIKFTVINK